MVQTQAHFSTDARFGRPARLAHDGGLRALRLHVVRLVLRLLRVVLAHQVLELLEVDGLLVDEHLGEVVEERAVRRQALLAHLVRVGDDLLHLRVDEALGLGRRRLRAEAAVAVGMKGTDADLHE